MKTFLILMFGRRINSGITCEEEKFEHYKIWGTYLSQFSDSPYFVSGSPLNREGYTISKSKTQQFQSLTLQGYMILKAKDIHGLEAMLIDCPILETEGAVLQVHEMDSQALISSQINEINQLKNA